VEIEDTILREIWRFGGLIICSNQLCVFARVNQSKITTVHSWRFTNHGSRI